MDMRFTRRAVNAALGASIAMPWVARAAFAQNPILLGVPTAQTAPVGTADHLDHLRGTQLAMEEINSSGGILGRELKLFTPDVNPIIPESIKQAFAACVDAKVNAISCAFVFIPIVAMDTTAKYKCPYLNGTAQREQTEKIKENPEKYSHVFQVDASDLDYGWTYPLMLEEQEKSGLWTPKNRKIHIVQEQSGYARSITRGIVDQVKKRGNFEIAQITDIQIPVQDWNPVVHELRQVDAGAIFINHWVAAELAAFTKQFVANPVKNSLVHLHYGPSQPEYLTLVGEAGNGFIWDSTIGHLQDERGLAFEKKYRERFPGPFPGAVYPGHGYDVAYLLKRAWEAAGDPENFAATAAAIRQNPTRGVCGTINVNNPWQEALHYPANGFDDELAAPSAEEGIPLLHIQIQDLEHKIVYPKEVASAQLQLPPWWS
ncbi:ABC transporter substrate-binding protein [Aminobacter sp. MDW-2]|uniref:ABC transporter substrate-binding protein n=1 Tax=Aminobacter sp. MDW-2 TaxID=2666139 RepID=UPI0012B0C595|nr:ABC transporter substrate-binding protein [Aminobacter sp. MDW-2]MRX37395.1 ABC transporter substrate-binding protein [Aminobacter sp. MDW-2]QNH37867.1 ABC transporter substrate-binding protein [Aminobacter sp. MDW-2]